MLTDSKTLGNIQKIFDIIAWSITGLSFISSFIVIYIIYIKRLYKNITNQFVIQITISEMINNITVLSSLLMNIIGTKEIKYTERMRICYAQIFSGLFSNFYTLISSLLISYRIYDLLLNNSMFFRQPKKIKIARIGSFYICFFFFYILWILHMAWLANYSNTSTSFVRVLSCWIEDYLDHIAICIFIILLLLNCFFCIKSYCFIGNYAQIFKKGNEYSTEEENDQNAKKEQIMKAKAVQQKLILYPLFTVILFIFIIAHRLLARFAKQSTFMSILTFILYTIPTCLRGFIFASVYFGTQEVFRKALLEVITCQRCRKKNGIIGGEDKSLYSLSTIVNEEE